MIWKKHAPFILILFLSFVLRLYLADWNSYWYDELISVKKYGVDHDSVFTMIDYLANRSVHPPLYQSILFFWINLFGETEASTRLLSNLYIVGATVFVYMLTYQAYSQRTAIFAVLLFTFSYDAMYFALEARSYAQTIFLSTVSSFMLYKWLITGLRLRSRWFWWLCLVNLAMLLTHYYNGVFIAAQSVFIFLYIRLENKTFDFLRPASLVLVPVITFLILWGPRMVSRYQVRESTPQSDIFDPVTIFLNVVLLNINVIFLFVFPLVFGLWIFLLIEAFLMMRRNPKLSTRQYIYLYLLAQITLIPIGAYMMAFIGKFTWRYVVYLVPHLMIFIAVLVEQTIILLHRYTAFKPARFYIRYAPWVIAVCTIIIVLPAGYQAARYQKEPWREVAHEIVNIIENNPEHTYLIYETGPSSTYMNFYFERLSDDIRLTGTMRREVYTEEAYLQQIEPDDIDRGDFLIIFFTHDNLTRHRFSLNRLCEDYTYYFSDMIDQRGYIIFDLRRLNGDSCPAFLREPEQT